MNEPTSSTVSKPWEHAKQAGSEGDPLAAQFVESLSYDRRLYQHDIAGSIAHARMLRHAGLLTDQELADIQRGLEEIQAEIEAAGPDDGAAWPGWKLELEDVHMCIEAALIEKVGDAGRKLHTGRSRNDQVALDLKLWIKQACGQLHGLFDQLKQAFVELAQRDGEIVMPSYTHLQRAQPIVVGGELMAWVSMFDRCDRRIEALWQVNQDNPLGSGAIAGSTLPLDRQHTAEALGVGPACISSMDATATRDAALDLVYALAMTAQVASRWAEQWIIYCSSEFGMLKLDDRYTTGSSMMPQKRNPDMLELIRGRCGNVYGNLVALLTICKGITIGYNRDLQEDKRHLFAAYDCVCAVLRMASRIVATARFDSQRIEQDLDRGFLDATVLAEYLVNRGVPFRTAHQVVGRLVMTCEKQGLGQLRDLPLDAFEQACQQVGAAGASVDRSVYDWLGSQQAAARYQSAGNAGLTGFRQQLATWRKQLGIVENTNA